MVGTSTGRLDEGYGTYRRWDEPGCSNLEGKGFIGGVTGMDERREGRVDTRKFSEYLDWSAP